MFTEEWLIFVCIASAPAVMDGAATLSVAIACQGQWTDAVQACLPTPKLLLAENQHLAEEATR